MPPKQLSSSDSAPAVTPIRPQLKIAVRATQDGHDSTKPATSAAITDAVRRWHGQWRGTLDTIKDLLADLERTCETTIEAREAGVDGLIDTLIGSATAEAAAAAERTRTEAQIEIDALKAEMAKLQSATDALQADLHAERDKLTGINEQLESEKAARIRTESERDETRREGQRALAAVESQTERLRAESDTFKAELTLARQQLDAAKAERSKLMATFQVVQRVLSHGPSGIMAAGAEDGGHFTTALSESRPHDVQMAKVSENAPTRSQAATGAVDTQVVAVVAHPEAVADIKQVLEQVKAMYDLDVKAGRSSAELVDSLSSSLRYARGVIIGRSSLSDLDAEALFDQQIDVLLSTDSGTSFGRHLSIAAYALRSPLPSAQGESGAQQPTGA